MDDEAEDINQPDPMVCWLQFMARLHISIDILKIAQAETSLKREISKSHQNCDNARRCCHPSFINYPLARAGNLLGYALFAKSARADPESFCTAWDEASQQFVAIWRKKAEYC
ncbi:unnamed protein product [Strongylus vulgaris]|uniref:Uncharacterized protein n=1 Tax=Strongylus vulgaris TaxID=40348 RepID=A0A3P7IYE3_STRVU|nr:unnamed protein product [Strongylus vulgaris]